MNPKEFSRQLENLAALEEPVRRRLYLYVVGHGGEVSREEAARGAGVSRALAAFHLDRLVEANLLEATFRRLTGREGPGAGRPSKLYRRSSVQFDVSLPQRRYEVAAQVLTEALARTGSGATLDASRDAAREYGERLGRELAPDASRGAPLTRAARALQVCGYEPRATGGDGGEVLLRNCPFDSIRNTSREVICGMNLALIEGLLSGLEAGGVQARLEPRPGHCCVALRRAPT